jgi:hypothetical protein
MPRRLRTALLCSVLFGGLLAGAPAEARVRATPWVESVQQIARQNVAPQPGSEPDTLVEPDVAISPVNPRIAVAAAHNGRFPDGGAVAIAYAWTRDGGKTWRHAAVPGLTKATGGAYLRASDPVVAFGPDGTAYLSTLLFDLPTRRARPPPRRRCCAGRTTTAGRGAARSPCPAPPDRRRTPSR